MSFGYSVGDFIGLPAMAWKVYTNLSSAPEKFRNLSGEVNSMHASLRLLEEALKDNKLSEQEKMELCGIGKNCEVVLQDVLSLLKKFRSLGSSSRKAIDRVGFALEDISEMRSRLVSHTTMLISFQSGLQSRRQDTILDILVQIRNDIQTGKRARSVLTTITAEEITEDNEDIWQVIAAEIEDAGLKGHVDESERYFIGEWIEEAISNGELESIAETQTNPDDEPSETMHHPNRAPPPLPQPRNVERDESVMSRGSSGILSSERTLAADDPVLETTIAEDENLAVAKELDTLLSVRKDPTGEYPLPWGWVKSPRGGFYNRFTFHHCSEMSPLDISSITTMAYETAPRCITTIERLENLLQASGMGDDLNTEIWDQVVLDLNDAFRSLKILKSAMMKFALLQDQTGSNTLYSDLDALKTEAAIIRHMHGDQTELLVDCPIESVELCQIQYFAFLKEALGFLHKFSIIFRGKTYVVGERSTIAHVWNESKMMARLRSIELKLQGWDTVEVIVRRCRTWIDSRQHPSRREDISSLATNLILDYEEDRRILNGYTGNSIQITVISASGLPSGNRVRPLNAHFKVKTRSEGILSSWTSETPWEYESKRAPRSNEPVWNDSFTLHLNQSVNTNFVIEVWDTILGMSNSICSCKLIYRPRGTDNEPTFEDKSLMYGYNEIKELSLVKLCQSNNWKAAGTLKLRIKWEGRYERVKQPFPPKSPPPEFYHTGDLPLPAWPKDGVHATEIERKRGWVQITNKQSGKQYYIDLLTNTTSWICPDPSYTVPAPQKSFSTITNWDL